MFSKIIEKGTTISRLIKNPLSNFSCQINYIQSSILFNSLKTKKHHNYLYSFSTNKDNNQKLKYTQQPKSQPQPTIQQDINKKAQTNSKQAQITPQQQLFNIALGIDKKHSFKNELVVSQQTYKNKLKDLKQAILFQDLLKRQIDILIYDTHGKPFHQHLLKLFFRLVGVFGALYLLYDNLKIIPKFKLYIKKTAEGQIFLYSILAMCGWLLLRTIFRHLRVTKRYVEKIVYNTQDQTFTFTKRRFICTKYQEKISRFKILYTENQALNRRGTNYLNIENQKEYQIAFPFAWKKQDLFSHLISQRIRT